MNVKKINVDQESSRSLPDIAVLMLLFTVSIHQEYQCIGTSDLHNQKSIPSVNNFPVKEFIIPQKETDSSVGRGINHFTMAASVDFPVVKC